MIDKKWWGISRNEYLVSGFYWSTHAHKDGRQVFDDYKRAVAFAKFLRANDETEAKFTVCRMVMNDGGALVLPK